MEKKYRKSQGILSVRKSGNQVMESLLVVWTTSGLNI